ncbi:MAG: cytochrome c biogenesis protein CcsA [Chthoniobacterales bacterium]
MDRPWLIVAALCYLASFGHTLYALGAGKFRPARFNLAAMLAGFGATTVFLVLRGQQVGACPITNLFEVLIFLSWSIVLIYLLVGPAYRLSLMGAFTAPLVLVIMIVALLAPADDPALIKFPNAWVEFHAALSIIAYGAFGLGAIAGVMYLVQERQLKRHTAGELFYNLPPITDLSRANSRLLFTGFILLTVAFAAGIAAGLPIANAKSITSFLIWGVYAAILLATRTGRLAPRRSASLSVVVFVVALVTLPAIQALSVRAGS